MQLAKNEKWLLLGASRGLGRAFFEISTQENSNLGLQLLTASRRAPSELHLDFTNSEKWAEYVEQFQKFSPTRIFYFAGGGPYGNYLQKNWKDHQWAFRLNFEFPAFLLNQTPKIQSLKQITFVGSSIAESKPDPGAASYCAGKHALKGLVQSVQQELKDQNTLDLRLFSPGYMDTGMLPANAWPRQQADLVKAPKDIAMDLFKWVQAADDFGGHRLK